MWRRPLLHGVLAADEVMVGRLVGLLRNAGRLELLLSVVESDDGPTATGRAGSPKPLP